MEKITYNKNNRPKSARSTQYLLTEPNKYNNCFFKKKYNLPNIKDKKDKKDFNKTYTKSKNFREKSHKTFFMLYNPFNFFRNKNNKNEFFIRYNGGPVKKFSLASKKLKLDISKIDNLKYSLKYNRCPISNTNLYNEKEKKKYNYIYNNLEEEKNDKYLNTFINPKGKIFKLKNKDNNQIEEEKGDKNDKMKDNNKNILFKLNDKSKLNFHKIQIHNNYKPYLVDDYRYYAEHYL